MNPGQLNEDDGRTYKVPFVSPADLVEPAVTVPMPLVTGDVELLDPAELQAPPAPPAGPTAKAISTAAAPLTERGGTAVVRRPVWTPAPAPPQPPPAPAAPSFG